MITAGKSFGLTQLFFVQNHPLFFSKKNGLRPGDYSRQQPIGLNPNKASLTQLLLDLNNFVYFDDIIFFDVVVVFNRQTAFQTRFYLTLVFFEALE